MRGGESLWVSAPLCPQSKTQLKPTGSTDVPPNRGLAHLSQDLAVLLRALPAPRYPASKQPERRWASNESNEKTDQSTRERCRDSSDCPPRPAGFLEFRGSKPFHRVCRSVGKALGGNDVKPRLWGWDSGRGTHGRAAPALTPTLRQGVPWAPAPVTCRCYVTFLCNYSDDPSVGTVGDGHEVGRCGVLPATRVSATALVLRHVTRGGVKEEIELENRREKN